MSRKLFVHIGTHKTGTTSIQSFLRQNAKTLSKYDMHVPAVGTLGPNAGHHNVAWHIRGDQRFNPERGDLDFLLLDLQKTPLPKAVISSEDLEYLVQYPDAVRKFETELHLIGWEVEYIVVFRRQDTYAESLYTQLIPYGMSISYNSFVEQLLIDGSVCIKSDWYFAFDYCDFYRKWKSISGHELKVVCFDKAIAEDGIITTFIRTLGLPYDWVDERKSSVILLNTTFRAGLPIIVAILIHDGVVKTLHLLRCAFYLSIPKFNLGSSD